MKVSSIVAREVKLQAELNKANGIIEKLNNEQDSPFLLYKEFKEEKEKILKDEVEQLKAENTKLKEENKSIDARSIVDKKRAQILKDEVEQLKAETTKLKEENEMIEARSIVDQEQERTLRDEVEQLKAKNTKLKEENEKIKTCSIVAQVAKLQEEVDTGEETIEKINEQKLSDEVEQLKAENTKLKEVNEKIEACSIAAQERAQTLKDAYKKMGGTHYHIQQRLWDLQDSYNELKDRYNKMRDRHSINDEDDEDASTINNGTNHDDDDDEYSLNVARKTLYFKCPYPSCTCDEKRPLTLKKDDYEAAYRLAYENKLLIGEVGNDLFDLSSHENAKAIRKFAKEYGKTKTALQDGIKFLRDHYLECHIGQNYPPLAIRDNPPDNIKTFYEGELAKQPFKNDPEVNYKQFQSTWYETKRGKVKPHHNINGDVYKELLTKALRPKEHKKIVIEIARNFWHC
jgi:myosin heavy subunit